MSSRNRTASSHNRWTAPENTYGYNAYGGATTRDLYRPMNPATTAHRAAQQDLHDIPDDLLYAGQNSRPSATSTAASFTAGAQQRQSLLPSSYNRNTTSSFGSSNRIVTSSAEPGLRNRAIGGFTPQAPTPLRTLPPGNSRNPPPGRPPAGALSSSGAPPMSYTHTYGIPPTPSPSTISTRQYSGTGVSSAYDAGSTYGGYTSSIDRGYDQRTAAPPSTNHSSAYPISTSSKGATYTTSSSSNNNKFAATPTLPVAPTTSALLRESRTSSSNYNDTPRLASPMGSALQSSGGGSSSTYIPKGFRNLGNTCFMNAALQALLAVPKFISYLRREGADRTAYLTNDLLELADPSTPSRGPCLQSLKRKVGNRNSEFSSYGQNDSHEFIRTLLVCVHEEINRVRGKKPYEEIKDDPRESDDDAARRWAEYHLRRDDSAINDIFAGQKKTVRTCKRCNTRSLNFDPFLDLSLALKGSDSVQIEALLSFFTGEEMLTSTDCMFICPSCKKPRDAIQHTTIQVWPQSLVLHLARFTNKGKKITTSVDFDKILEIDPKWGGGASSRGLPKYDLTGVVVHTGTMDFGHYYAYVKVGSKWYLCDDNTVSESSSTAAAKEQRGAYMLFYSRQVSDAH